MTEQSPLLDVDEITKRFDRTVAVDDVSFSVDPGKTYSLIGPNGAGKTTLFNCICGDLAPTSGRIHFAGDEITDLPQNQIARAGISRSYQITNLFDEFTTFENLRVASQIEMMDSMTFRKPAHSFERPIRRATELIELIGLEDEHDTLVSSLSHGQKRLLEIGVSLAIDPDLLLLDEPIAGVSSDNIGDITDLIREIGAERTILLVEHNIDVVMDISDTILVLNQGSLIAEGSPEEIRTDDRVQQAYLGTDDASVSWGENSV